MYILINGEQINQEHPETFLIPSISEKNTVKIGDYLKIGVYVGAENVEAERFWVKVLSINKDKTITSSVSNDLVFTKYHGLKDKDIVEIKLEHILSILNG